MDTLQVITASSIGTGIVVTTLIILLLITAIAITIILARRDRIKNDLVLTQTRLTYETELRSVESEVRETTLSQVAAELHDNIGQLLAVAHFQLEKELLVHPESSVLLTPTKTTIQMVMNQVRLLSHSLSGDFVSEGGLQHSISNEIQRLKGIAKLAIAYETDDVEPDLAKDTRTIVFRIFQEIISNSLKHSKARNMSVKLTGGEFLLQIRDDGKGFDKELALQSNKGFGLKNMLRRASLASLNCEIVSAPCNGTTFTISQSDIL